MHPAFAPVPASDIGVLIARIIIERPLDGGRARALESSVRPRGKPSRALFTSIPPSLDRKSVERISIGSIYQRRCIDSWRRSGFEVYSVHFAEELGKITRHDGVTYLAAERTVDDGPEEYKPSFRAILKAIDEVGADLSGVINSDIFLVNPPGWVERVEEEVEGSAILFTRYETNDIDMTIVGWAPWGFDLVFFDRALIEGLQYCGMRIGETWWDYWLPLSLYFSGAHLKHVEDCVALHLDHPIVSNKNVQTYGLLFFDHISAEAEAAKQRGETTRLTEFWDWMEVRFALNPEGHTRNDRSLEFVAHVLNTSVWAGISRILRTSKLRVTPHRSEYDDLLAEFLLRGARYADHLAAREQYFRNLYRDAQAAAAARPNPADVELVNYARAVTRSWPYATDLWLTNRIRALVGQRPKPRREIGNIAEATDLMRRLRRHLIWRLLRHFSAKTEPSVARRKAMY
jgi:hypothetical protein